MHHLASSSASISQCLQPCAVSILFLLFSQPSQKLHFIQPSFISPYHHSSFLHRLSTPPPLFSVHLSIHGSPSMPSCMWRMHFSFFFFLKMEKNCYNWSQPVFVIVCSFPSLTGIGGKNGFLGLGCFLGEEKSVVSAQRTSYDIFLFFGKECVEWTSVYRKNERVVQVRQQCRASQPRPVGGCVQNGAVCCCKENGEVNGETAMHLQDIKSVISQWCVRERLFSHCQCKTSYFYYHFWQIWLPSDCRSGQLTDQLLILVHFFFSPFMALPFSYIVCFSTPWAHNGATSCHAEADREAVSL